jgi:hypothetical protein
MCHFLHVVFGRLSDIRKHSRHRSTRDPADGATGKSTRVFVADSYHAFCSS